MQAGRAQGQNIQEKPTGIQVRSQWWLDGSIMTTCPRSGTNARFFTEYEWRRVRLVGVRKRINPKWLFL